VRVAGLFGSIAEVTQPLSQEAFRRLWLSTFAWNFARWMEMTVTGWVALQLTGSPWLVALTGVFRSAFLPVAGPITGALSDRFDRVTLMKAAQWGNVAVIGAVAVALLAGKGAYWQIVAATLWLGASWGIDWPSRRALIADLVEPEQVLKAVLLDNWTQNISRVAGPLLAGGILALWGSGWAYAALTLSFLIASTTLFKVSGTSGTSGATGATGSGRPRPVIGRPSMWRDLAAGLRSVQRDGAVWGVLIVTVLMNCLLFPYQQLLSVFAEQVLHVGPVGLGAMGAANGVGAVVGLLVLARFRSLRAQALAFVGGSTLACAALILFSMVTFFPLALLLLLATGLGTCAFGTMQSTIILSRTTPAMRGRAMGLLAMAIGSAPLGALEMGLLVERLGAPLAVALNAALCGVVVVAVAWRNGLLGGGRSVVEPRADYKASA
jgi:MFS family permease